MAQKRVDPGKSAPGGNQPYSTGRPPPYEDPNKSARQKFLAWSKQQGITAKIASDIWHWGHFYGRRSSINGEAFAYYYASVLVSESGVAHKNEDGSLKRSSANALGIAQVMPGMHEIPWQDGKVADEKWLSNYGNNIRFGAYYLAQGVAQHGFDRGWADYYHGGGDSVIGVQKTILGRLPKGLNLAPSSGTGVTPTPGGSPYPDPGDPYVSGVKKGGKLALTNDGNKALRWDGLPIKHSEFLRLKRDLETTYVQFTGDRPSNAQVQLFIQKGWSGYTLETVLSKQKSFRKSPLWASKAPGYEESARGLLGDGEKLDPELVRQAIVNNWDGSTFQGILRKREGYVNSNEFKGSTATLLNVFQSIYGEPDPGSMATVREAALAGWDVNQFAAWLRSRDEYVYTPEYRDKAMRFLDELGFLTGNMVTLAPGQDKSNPGQPTGFGPLPNDPRVKGQRTLPKGPGFVGGNL